MRLRLYSLRDRLLGVYLAPFVARGDVEALRQLSSSMSDPSMKESQLVRTPADFELRYMASFDDESGDIFPESHAAGPCPALLCSCDRVADHLALRGA